MIKFHIEREKESTLYNAASIPRVSRVNKKISILHNSPPAAMTAMLPTAFTDASVKDQISTCTMARTADPGGDGKITGRRTCRAKKNLAGTTGIAAGSFKLHSTLQKRE